MTPLLALCAKCRRHAAALIRKAPPSPPRTPPPQPAPTPPLQRFLPLLAEPDREPTFYIHPSRSQNATFCPKCTPPPPPPPTPAPAANPLLQNIDRNLQALLTHTTTLLQMK